MGKLKNEFIHILQKKENDKQCLNYLNNMFKEIHQDSSNRLSTLIKENNSTNEVDFHKEIIECVCTIMENISRLYEMGVLEY